MYKRNRFHKRKITAKNSIIMTQVISYKISSLKGKIFQFSRILIYPYIIPIYVNSFSES